MGRIVDYPLAQPLDGTEELLSVQNDLSRRLTAEQLRVYNEENILTGDITLSLSVSGGDFSTLSEVFNWIGKTSMRNVNLTITVQPGTYNVLDAGTDITSYNLVASQVSRITFAGDDSATCYFNMSNSTVAKPFITATNMVVIIKDITFNNAGQAGVIAVLDSSVLNMENVLAPQLDHIISATNGSNVLLTTCSFGCTAYGLKMDSSSNLLIDDAVLNGNGIAGVAVHAVNNSSVVVRGGVTITNFGAGFLAQNTSKIALSGPHTLTGNILNYNPPLNQFQGDGSYITDGDLDISSPDTKFESLSNKNQPSGYVGLDTGGKIPTSLLPPSLGYTEEIQEYGTFTGFPATGDSGTLYIATDTGVLYRWGLVETSPSTWANMYINITDAGYFQ